MQEWSALLGCSVARDGLEEELISGEPAVLFFFDWKNKGLGDSTYQCDPPNYIITFKNLQGWHK